MNTNEVSLHLSKLLGPPWPWTIKGRHCLARFADLKISYSGGLRDDCSGLHTFLFLKRKGRFLLFLFQSQHCKMCEISLWMLLGVIWWFVWLILLPSPCRSDVPSNIRIDSFGPGAEGVASHHEDVIVVLKRYCSDKEVCQAHGAEHKQFKKNKIINEIWYEMDGSV